MFDAEAMVLAKRHGYLLLYDQLKLVASLGRLGPVKVQIQVAEPSRVSQTPPVGDMHETLLSMHQAFGFQALDRPVDVAPSSGPAAWRRPHFFRPGTISSPGCAAASISTAASAPASLFPVCPVSTTKMQVMDER